ncbi:serine hydrolase domain-containing protein [Sphingobacterium spiritivorum]|uniref:serine hydrolase domain-containing protein n=1 Tax=Sphingobacterium spiritivorum TaxID=258 RepID=UPI00191B7F19|nr:serine hydrolase domain-containing protein [Sphingobacterium spiritivorum]QQT24888.1 beta-lactamase family protein [Sphingobacterium spiritivorum]
MSDIQKIILPLLFIFSSASIYAQHSVTAKSIQQIAEKYQAVGVAAVVVKDNKIVFTNNYGYQDRDTHHVLNDSTLFRIASISKSFSATAVMQLVEAGRLSLKDDCSQLIGFPVRNPRFPDQIITLEMLLSHTSGINDKNGYFDLDVINPQKNKNWSDSYNAYAPGKGYQYCNLNFNMVGAIIEKISDQRFDKYVAEHILRPLDLYGGYYVDALDRSRFATLYAYQDGKFVPQPAAYNPRSEEISSYELGHSTPLFSPTGGMKISARDLAQYMIMHMNYGHGNGKKIISKRSAVAMQTKRSDEENYGLALWSTDSLIPQVHLTGHTGSAYGLYSTMFFNPKHKYGFVVITNGCRLSETSGFNMMLKEIVNVLYQDFIK